jgi:hypothetical protein
MKKALFLIAGILILLQLPVQQPANNTHDEESVDLHFKIV